MRYPAINKLLEKVDNKYSLILVTAKRARQLIDGAPTDIVLDNKNPVSIATEEIIQDKIKYEYK
ncbi:DNA-directed RNA polymerase subunit omega [Alkalibaculum sp. M08DMB]|uniref:DNA-directed RNA polymerase subunit omega n=1 Tax=Alkalibaculum sporogenes TaxID=2655001 RepID=A0A6A7K976_9FIRM|nr:DNA-directed RNA polymerase subunit omega [Alkalibaculum sporogenes]MPW26028.1 DNA-directed RNA polymerase subunit omega [Alkalibaculum sporogenes]